MPTYEYQCLDCGQRSEYLQSMRDAPITECPICKGHLQRLVSSGTGLIFKGSGFYVNDYKKPNGSGENAHHKLKPASSDVSTAPKETKTTEKAEGKKSEN